MGEAATLGVQVATVCTAMLMANSACDTYEYAILTTGAAPVPPSAPSTVMKSGVTPVASIACTRAAALWVG